MVGKLMVAFVFISLHSMTPYVLKRFYLTFACCIINIGLKITNIFSSLPQSKKNLQNGMLCQLSLTWNSER